MNGNPTYATPAVPLADITAAADDLEKAANDAKFHHDAWLAAEAKVRDAEKKLDDALTNEARYVEHAAGGDETKLLSSGFSLAKVPVKSSAVLPAPGELSATHGDHDGEVDLQWHAVKGTRSYQIQTAPDAAGPWTMVGASSSSKDVLPGITKPTWIRVAALGANGLSAWGDPVRYSPPG